MAEAFLLPIAHHYAGWGNSFKLLTKVNYVKKSRLLKNEASEGEISIAMGGSKERWQPLSKVTKAPPTLIITAKRDAAPDGQGPKGWKPYDRLDRQTNWAQREAVQKQGVPELIPDILGRCSMVALAGVETQGPLELGLAPQHCNGGLNLKERAEKALCSDAGAFFIGRHQAAKKT